LSSVRETSVHCIENGFWKGLATELGMLITDLWVRSIALAVRVMLGTGGLAERGAGASLSDPAIVVSWGDMGGR